MQQACMLKVVVTRRQGRPWAPAQHILSSRLGRHRRPRIQGVCANPGPAAAPAQVLDALGESVPCAQYDRWICYSPEGVFPNVANAQAYRCVRLLLFCVFCWGRGGEGQTPRRAGTCLLPNPRGACSTPAHPAGTRSPASAALRPPWNGQPWKRPWRRCSRALPCSRRRRCAVTLGWCSRLRASSGPSWR